MLSWARIESRVGAAVGVAFIVVLAVVELRSQQFMSVPSIQSQKSTLGLKDQRDQVGPVTLSFAQHVREEGTEFWPAFFGYRLKVTDTLVAGSTALLFFATLALWLATRALVRSAEETAQRQLRAYISITPKLVFNWRHPTHHLGISMDIENHGQTIGFEIRHNFGMAILDSPLPDDFIPPKPDRQYNQNNSLFPRVSVPVRLFYGRALADAEATDIETGNKRFYIQGVMTYRDAFQRLRTTKFSFSFGGVDFANSMKKISGATWNWEHGQYHNDAT